MGASSSFENVISLVATAPLYHYSTAATGLSTQTGYLSARVYIKPEPARRKVKDIERVTGRLSCESAKLDVSQ